MEDEAKRRRAGEGEGNMGDKEAWANLGSLGRLTDLTTLGTLGL